MSLRCATCLSIGRTLIPVKKIFYLVNVWHNIKIKSSHNICWECEAIFKKIWRFKHQILKAQDLLEGNMFEVTNVESFSNLSKLKTINICVTDLCHEQVADTKRDDTGQEIFNDFYFDDEAASLFKQESVEYDSSVEVYKQKMEKLGVIIKKLEPQCTREEYEDVETKEDAVVEEEPVEKEESDVDVSNELSYNKSSSKYCLNKIITEKELFERREKDKMRPLYINSPFKCENCIIAYHDEEKYLKHMNGIHAEENGNFMCNICKSYFACERSLKTHVKNHFIVYECRKCEHRDFRVTNMVTHYSIKHGRKFPCMECGLAFKSQYDRKKHLNTEHREKLSCKECKIQFRTMDMLRNHLLSCHNSKYLCDYCQEIFQQKEDLKKHMASHDNDKVVDQPYCVECDMHFKNQGTYKNHMKNNIRHRDERILKFECSECAKKFYCKTSLERHLKRHFNILEHKCELCHKCYIRKDQLRKHLAYSHNGMTRPRHNVCQVCNKGFARVTTLLNHMRTHTGEKPFKCEICEASFAQLVSLNTHTRHVHLRIPRRRYRGRTEQTVIMEPHGDGILVDNTINNGV